MSSLKSILGYQARTMASLKCLPIHANYVQDKYVGSKAPVNRKVGEVGGIWR